MKEYIRVGTEYFKLVDFPLMSGDSSSDKMEQTIIDGFDKEDL
jgi:hypothetical protein